MRFDRSLLISDLSRDEGVRLVPYDDATGKPVQTGDVVKGNLTNGIGWNMQGRPLTQAEAEIICGWALDDLSGKLYKALPWLSDLDEPRQRAVANLAFNLGVAGLLQFTTFLNFLKQGSYSLAALDLEGALWYKQVGERAMRIAQIIKTGDMT